jgi:hypothetical protein
MRSKGFRAEKTRFSLPIFDNSDMLPVEMWENITSFLSGRDSISLISSCGAMKELLDSDERWLERIKSEFTLEYEGLMEYAVDGGVEIIDVLKDDFHPDFENFKKLYALLHRMQLDQLKCFACRESCSCDITWMRKNVTLNVCHVCDVHMPVSIAEAKKYYMLKYKEFRMATP